MNKILKLFDLCVIIACIYFCSYCISGNKIIVNNYYVEDNKMHCKRLLEKLYDNSNITTPDITIPPHEMDSNNYYDSILQKSCRYEPQNYTIKNSRFNNMEDKFLGILCSRAANDIYEFVTKTLSRLFSCTTKH